MSEPTGPELAARLRDLLPTAKQPWYDEDLDGYSYEIDDDPSGPTNSVCGALMALTGQFRACLADREFANAGAIIDEMERLLGDFPLGEGLDGSTYNSVLACFLESVLPVEREAYDAIRPHFGPLITSHARRYDPWWLGPEPIAKDAGT